MEQTDTFLELETEFEDEFDKELIKRNHKTIELLAKKGYKMKKPQWYGLIAS